MFSGDFGKAGRFVKGGGTTPTYNCSAKSLPHVRTYLPISVDIVPQSRSYREMYVALALILLLC